MKVKQLMRNTRARGGRRLGRTQLIATAIFLILGSIVLAAVPSGPLGTGLNLLPGDEPIARAGIYDVDNDGVANAIDNCMIVANPDQADRDGDKVGDACEGDLDNDGVVNASDACPNEKGSLPNGCNPPDADGDGVPDATDPQPNDPNIPTGFGGASNLDDVLTGTAAADRICGLLGDDVVNALGGDDTVFGDLCNARAKVAPAQAGAGGNDTLNGGKGDDILYGAGGNDKLLGDSGNDKLGGGDGHDSLSGGKGKDSLSGDKGNDTLTGGTDVNRYKGGSGNDSISARNGKTETVDCGAGKKDSATVDRTDKVKGCEKVKRPKKK